MTSAIFEAETMGEALAGPFRNPVNESRAALGSIHDDATAQKLGFRGGTVAGNIHFEQFPPLAMARLGEDWRKTGTLSLHFMSPTTDGEPVRAFVGEAADAESGVRRAPAWMETPEGVRVCEGTASVGGPDADSELRHRLKSVRPASDLRMLQASTVGDTCKAIPARIDSEKALKRLEGVTESLPEYRDASIFGARVAAPAVAIDLLRVVEGPLFKTDRVGPYVGMFGAIELEFIDGPIFLDHDYLADGVLLALSESPKTEVAWYESVVHDAVDGRAVARLIMMTRLLKASSPLWA